MRSRFSGILEGPRRGGLVKGGSKPPVKVSEKGHLVVGWRTDGNSASTITFWQLLK